MTSWQLFIATFFSLDFAVSLLVIWGLALLMGVFLLTLPNLSRYMESKTEVPGLPNEELVFIKKTVYFAAGVFALFQMFAFATTGLFSFFLEALIKWGGASYLLVTVGELRKISVKEFFGFVIPFYAWEMKKQKEQGKNPDKITVRKSFGILFAVFVVLVVLFVFLSSTLS